ncbi:hypothetical protein [Streptomyces hypolithicus]
MDLTEWVEAQGVHPQTARRWCHEGTLPVLAMRVGPRTILVNIEANQAVDVVVGMGLYARVSSHDRKADLARQRAHGRRSARNGARKALEAAASERA